MNFEKSLEKLYSLHTFGIKLGLDNIKTFLNRTGNPEKKLKTIHIAGSNGKGSTSSFIASILMEHNLKTGLYTSPHFVRFNERIRINGAQIPDDFVVSYFNLHENLIDELKLTFFEVTTAIAFEYFAANKVDYAVIETGLGGRLDATNVIIPEASVITSISLEHTNILGDTIEAISKEKAGIIKTGIPVFLGRLPVVANNVLQKISSQLGSELYKILDYTNEIGGVLELYTDELELDITALPLKGYYQKYNAALAGLVISVILKNYNVNLIERGFSNVVKNTRIEGRYEQFNEAPQIIFDSAHNPEGIRNFLSEFNSGKKNYSKKVVLFGAMKDKAVEEMLNMIWEYFDEIHITSVQNERSCSISDFRKIASGMNLRIIEEKNPAEFVKKFVNEDPDSVLVVLGSMYLLGQIKSFLAEIA